MIKYQNKSLCGEVCDEEIDEVCDWLIESGFVLDPHYLEHIRRYNGGIPTARFFPGGQIERMLNFADSYSGKGQKFRDSNVNVVRTWIKDRVPLNIVPFASMPHGAFLCFAYSTVHIPAVVMWNNEAYEPEFVPIAESFRGFLQLLSDTPCA